MSTTSTAPIPDISKTVAVPPTIGVSSQGKLLQSFVSSIVVALTTSTVEVVVFLLLRTRCRGL